MINEISENYNLVAVATVKASTASIKIRVIQRNIIVLTACQHQLLE